MDLQIRIGAGTTPTDRQVGQPSLREKEHAGVMVEHFEPEG